MGIIRNDNLDIRVGKPVRNTDVVGPNQTYSSKENIPMTYRYEFMETIDESGVEWQLVGGTGNGNWKHKTIPTEQPVEFITWNDLVIKNTNNQVKIWDRYKITDRGDKPLSIEQIDPMGGVWFNWVNTSGTLILIELPKNEIKVDLNKLPTILRERLINN